MTRLGLAAEELNCQQLAHHSSDNNLTDKGSHMKARSQYHQNRLDEQLKFFGCKLNARYRSVYARKPHIRITKKKNSGTFALGNSVASAAVAAQIVMGRAQARAQEEANRIICERQRLEINLQREIFAQRTPDQFGLGLSGLGQANSILGLTTGGFWL